MSEASDRARTVRRWVEKAENDLRNAEHTLTLDPDCPFDTVAFHAQQCAEKYLKALLTWHQIAFPRTHDLRLLLQLVPATVTLGLAREEVVRLTRYAVETRYPGDWEPIERAEAEEAVRIAREVRDAVRSALPLDAIHN